MTNNDVDLSQAPPANPRYSQEASQAERSRILKEQARVIAEQEARSAGTRAAYNNVVDPLPSGRWSKPSRGNDPSQLYPRLPANSPWHHDPVPNEEPLGIDISYVEPCGTQAEIAASSSPAAVHASPPAVQADDLSTASSSANLMAGSSQATTSVAPGVDERVTSPPFLFRRRLV
jgi:hypothetical protein